MTKEKLQDILTLHRMWAHNKDGGRRADLRDADLQGADLRGAYLQGAYLRGAYLRDADLRGAYLRDADLRDADLQGADLQGADLRDANLQGAVGLIKSIGVVPGNLYYKHFGEDLINNNFKFFVGLNKLPKDETFADDERVLYSHPGFYFASESWCALNYGDRPYKALIQIPKNAKINEPWATDGKASADRIKIITVWDNRTGEDVTDRFRRPKK